MKTQRLTYLTMLQNQHLIRTFSCDLQSRLINCLAEAIPTKPVIPLTEPNINCIIGNNFVVSWYENVAL